MICNNCSKANDSGSNFCKYCGNNLDPTANDPHRTIFENAYLAHPKSNIDLGYLIISILILINVFLWFFWGFIFGGADMSNNRMLYKAIRVISTFFSVAQFVVMFIFAKRQAYKIVIAIIAAIVMLYDLYYLMQTLADTRY